MANCCTNKGGQECFAICQENGVQVKLEMGFGDISVHYKCQKCERQWYEAYEWVRNIDEASGKEIQ